MKKLLFGMVLTTGLTLYPLCAQDRADKQQDRIKQGDKSGQLTPGESAHLEHQQAKIDKQVVHDKKANGGTMTPQEKKQVTGERDRASRNIYRDKHNSKTATPPQQ